MFWSGANQAKPLRGVTPSRRSTVPGGGRRWFTNRALAHVRTSGGPASPTQRLFRVARSSPNLCARPSLTRSNRRGTGPVCPDGSRHRGGAFFSRGLPSVVERPPMLLARVGWVAGRSDLAVCRRCCDPQRAFWGREVGSTASGGGRPPIDLQACRQTTPRSWRRSARGSIAGWPRSSVRLRPSPRRAASRAHAGNWRSKRERPWNCE